MRKANPITLYSSWRKHSHWAIPRQRAKSQDSRFRYKGCDRIRCISAKSICHTGSMEPAKLFLWPGGALYLGPLSDNSRHRHHAAQICVGHAAHPFRLQLETDEWFETTFAFLPSNQPHRFEGSNASHIIVLVDGEGAFGQCRKGPVLSASPPPVSPLKTIEDAKAYTENLANALGIDHLHPRDQRIQRALDFIQSLDFKQVSIEDLASAAALSESRFQHLFKQQIGIPAKRYLLWRRLLDSIYCIMEGSDLTEAAHMGGFSDSAHFSRTFRETFGLAPSALFKNSRIVQVIIERAA